MKVETRLADYNNAEDAKNIIEQLDEYARDPMGGGIALSKDVKENLIPTWRNVKMPYPLLFLSMERLLEWLIVSKDSQHLNPNHYSIFTILQYLRNIEEWD